MYYAKQLHWRTGKRGNHQKKLKATQESAYLHAVKWFKHYYYYYFFYYYYAYNCNYTLHPTTKKGKGEERAASRRKEKVIAGIAACAVGAMMSLPLRVIMYTHRQKNRMTKLIISSNVHYAHLGGDKNTETEVSFWYSVLAIFWTLLWSKWVWKQGLDPGGGVYSPPETQSGGDGTRCPTSKSSPPQSTISLNFQPLSVQDLCQFASR